MNFLDFKIQYILRDCNYSFQKTTIRVLDIEKYVLK